MKKLLLAGAGHAHIGLLRRLSNERADDAIFINTDVTLITEQPQTIYSGMLPGWMAGHYQLDDICIDVKSLCLRAGVRFVQRPIVKVDATSRTVITSGNKQCGAGYGCYYNYDYDVLSLNTGADTNLDWLETNKRHRFDKEIADKEIADKEGIDKESTYKENIYKQTSDTKGVIAIRPLHYFARQWQQIIAAAKQTTHYRLAIVGAGAAAMELVMAAQVILQQIHPSHQAYLVCGEHLLSGFDNRFRKRVIGQLKRHDIEVVFARAIGFAEGRLLLSDSSSTSSFEHSSQQSSQTSLPVDAVIAATGVTGSAWTAHTDIATIDNGFIAVNRVQQSTSHPNVFAVGDVCTRVDQDMAHSGVHAVFGGIVEADNLLAYLADEPLQSYQPKKRTLYLLSCGDKYAIGSWGKYSLQGRWVWTLKRYIDKRFINAK
ncbi:MAG: FAD-dependent oxidoreductase [Psychrobacter sp.]|nr:FAD-dependent oxidoreductase [Psychrobacter sp.]